MNQYILSIPLVILALMLNGCGVISSGYDLKAEIRYIFKDGKIEVLDADTNFPQHSSTFIWGFKLGYMDYINETMTLIHFEEGSDLTEYFYMISKEFGYHLAENDDKARKHRSGEDSELNEPIIRTAHFLKTPDRNW